MDKLSIILREDNVVFAPGQTIQGTIRWNLDEHPRQVSLSLLWYTSGKGTRDAGVVETMQLDNPGASGSHAFSFTLPPGPYSFSGKLISLIWALELTASPGAETVRKEITVSPTGREILLTSVAGATEDSRQLHTLRRILGVPDASA